MAILTHPLLLRIAQHVDKKKSPIRWIDLYAAQYMASAISSLSRTSRQTNPSSASSAKQGQTLDLFAEDEASSLELSQEDLLVLGLMCSYVTSLGQTYLSLQCLPLDVLNTAIICGYQPAFNTPDHLAEQLKQLDAPDFLAVVARASLTNSVYDQDCPTAASEINAHHASLILCEDRLYLARYWELHQRFEAWLFTRAYYIKKIPADVIPKLSKLLSILFNLDQKSVVDLEEQANAENQVDWQALAAAQTLINPFSLITGGPGTGKTTTAASLLCLLICQYHLEQESGSNESGTHGLAPSHIKPKINIHLLAPTGKAAVRLADAIRHQMQHIESRLTAKGVSLNSMSDCLPDAGETVHRFLYRLGGLRDAVSAPRAFSSDKLMLMRSQQRAEGGTDQQNGPLDIIIVDESSMMDLALMVELVSLIPDHTRLIFLGDHFQLPAVDPGQVFADCVARFSCQQLSAQASHTLAKLTGFPEQLLADTAAVASPELGFQPLSTLRKTYRFGGDLKRAADHIKQGDLAAFSERFRVQDRAGSENPDVIWHSLHPIRDTDYAAIVKGYQAYFDAVASMADLSTLARHFEAFQLLCSTLEGPLGVEYLNRFVEQHYQHAWQSRARTFSMRDGGVLYHGKAILVSRNHPHLGIFNGDIGFVMEDARDANLNVHFPAANQSVIIVPPARIHEWQTAYAMTVHKSQGSEYRRVGVVLADYAKELLTRRLLYTAVTRSKEQCEIWASDEALKKAFE